MAVDAVISEEMRIGCDRAEVVDRNNLDVLAASLMQGAQDQPTDASKAVDGYSYRYVSPPIDFHADIAALGNLAP